MRLPMFPGRRGGLAVALAGALALGGCATTAERIAPADALWQAGDPVGALALLDALRPEAGTDAALVDLDRASALLALGRYREAADAAVAAGRMLALHEEEDAGEWVAAALSDDTALAFEGADHEKVLALVTASLAMLLDGQPDEARALALQVDRMQERLMEREVLPSSAGEGAPRRSSYRKYALGAFLAALSDEMRGHFDEAALGYVRAAEWEPSLDEARRSLERVRTSRLTAEEGRGAVVVFALAGPGPILVESAEPVTSQVLMVASALLNARRGAGLPSQAPVLVPVAAARPSPLVSFTVESPGEPARGTETVLDVSAVAEAQARDDLPRRLLRAVLRRALKEVAKNRVKAAVTKDGDDGAGGLLLDLAGLIWTGAERADTRCWSFLPDTVQVARVELPPGPRLLRVVPRGRGGEALGEGATVEVRVEPGRIAVVLVVAPHPASVRAAVDALSAGQ